MSLLGVLFPVPLASGPVFLQGLLCVLLNPRIKLVRAFHYMFALDVFGPEMWATTTETSEWFSLPSITSTSFTPRLRVFRKSGLGLTRERRCAPVATA
jgi:hypothetical protein